MKIVRILIYEGEPKVLAKQLGSSLPEGIKNLPNLKLTVINVGSLSDLACSLVEAIELQREERNQ